MAIIMEDKKYIITGDIIVKLSKIFSCIEENKIDIALFELGVLQEMLGHADIDEIINS